MRLYIILGGFVPGPDGYLTSAGLHILRWQLAREFPKATIQTYQWSSWQKAELDMAGNQDEKIGATVFSGGGSRFSWIGYYYPHTRIDVATLYDPSPKWQMKPITHSAIQRCISFENSLPLFGGLGGGKLVGRPGQIEVVPIAIPHMFVQFDQSLHDRTIHEFKVLESANDGRR